MATQTDVTNALMALIKSAVYPNGTGQPSIVTIPVKVITGYAGSVDLTEVSNNTDALVTVYRSTAKKTLYSFIGNWSTLNLVTPTLSLIVFNNTVTVTGTVFTPSNCLIKVNNVSYHYAVLNTDTLQTIATNLAALIPGATVVGTVITISNAYKVETKIGTTGTAMRSVGDVQENYWIDVWAADNATRQTIADALLVALRVNYRFNLVDGAQATLNSDFDKRDFDKSQKVGVYRSMISIFVAYQLTQKATFYTITDIALNTSYVPEII